MRFVPKRDRWSMLCAILTCFTSWIICSISSAAEPLDVFVVNYPIKYFAERIGGEHVKVIFPAPPDVDPAYWRPDIDAIGSYQQADLILLNGAAYAKWTKTVSLPRSRLINTSKKFKDRYLPIEGTVTHSHGPGGKHAHKGVAFTTWLDFRLAVQQAEAIKNAIGQNLPQHHRIFEQNFEDLKSDLLSLDKAIRQVVDQAPSAPLVASHPVYDYLARGYGMNLKSVHWEPDEIPNDTKWLELKSILQEHPAEWMIWEGDPDPAIVAALKSMGMKSTVFKPGANVPEQGDFLTVMQKNLDGLRRVYAK